MSKSTGTPKGIETWLRSQRLEPGSIFSLAVQSLEGSEIVGSWEASLVAAGVEAWTCEVCELATHDAEGRGQTTRYALRHDRDDKNRGMTSLRRVVVDDDDRDRLSFDGTNAGLVSKLLASLERAQSQVIEASKGAVEAQRASMALLTASYGMLGQLQIQNAGLHAQTIDLRATVAEATPAPVAPDMMHTMIETMGPHVAARLVEKFLPLLLGDSDDHDAPSSASETQQ